MEADSDCNGWVQRRVDSSAERGGGGGGESELRQSCVSIDIIIIILIILLVENVMEVNTFDTRVCVSVSVRAFVYESCILNAPQAWKQRLKQCGSFPFRTSRSFLGCSVSLERMCWMYTWQALRLSLISTWLV